MATLVIQLPDGSALATDDGDWQLLASATHDSLASDGGLSNRLVVQTSHDNRILIYAEVETATGIVRSGEILPPENPNIIATLQQVATLYGLAPYCFQACLEQLYRKGPPSS
jgi:hypothetical protein